MINEIENINGFILRNRDGYLRIGDEDLGNHIPLNEKNILKALSIMKRNSLAKLSFGTPYDDIKDISFLEDFPFLQGVEIGSEDINITPLYECCELKEIRIYGNYIGSIDFSRFPKLSRVLINWDNSGVETLFNCKNIKQLYILKYDGSTLLEFESMSKLKVLNLYDPKVKSLEGIGHLNKLEQFEISGATQLYDLGDIENASNLSQLFLYGAKNIEDLTPIKYLKNLQVLNLDNLGRIPTIRFLESLKNLEECYLAESTNIVDGDMSVLENLRRNSKLRKVIFTNRKHYSHTCEQLGYQIPASVKAVFNKK